MSLNIFHIIKIVHNFRDTESDDRSVEPHAERNSNNAAVAAESHKIGADSFIIETRIELFRIAERFSEWEKQMCEKKELLMDGRFDNEIRTMNVAFYQLDEALRRILAGELEFDILRHDCPVE